MKSFFEQHSETGQGTGCAPTAKYKKDHNRTAFSKKRKADLEVTNRTATVHKWKQTLQRSEDKGHLKKRSGAHDNTMMLVFHSLLTFFIPNDTTAG